MEPIRLWWVSQGFQSLECEARPHPPELCFIDLGSVYACKTANLCTPSQPTTSSRINYAVAMSRKNWFICVGHDTMLRVKNALGFPCAHCSGKQLFQGGGGKFDVQFFKKNTFRHPRVLIHIDLTSWMCLQCWEYRIILVAPNLEHFVLKDNLKALFFIAVFA